MGGPAPSTPMTNPTRLADINTVMFTAAAAAQTCVAESCQHAAVRPFILIRMATCELCSPNGTTWPRATGPLMAFSKAI